MVDAKLLHGNMAYMQTISVFLHDWYYLAVPHVIFLPVFLFPETRDYATRGFSETQNLSKLFTSFQVTQTLYWYSFCRIFLFPTNMNISTSHKRILPNF